MAEGWYCKIADQELGPLSADQLRTLASQGRISPDDPVRREGMDSWAPAGRVKGLFPPSNSAASAPSNTSAKSLPQAKPLGASQPPAQPQGPKAPPTARPVSSRESPSTTPAAIPVARLPGALNQFSIVTDDTSPLGAHGQSDGPTKIAGKKNRQRNGMLAAAGAVLAVGLAVGGVALYLYGGSGNDDQADTSSESAEGGIPGDLDLSEDAVASVSSPSVYTPPTASSGGDSSDDDVRTDASTGSISPGEGSLPSEIPARMLVPVEESEPERPPGEDRETADGENPREPADTESVEQGEPVEEIPVPRDRIPIPGLHDEATE